MRNNISNNGIEFHSEQMNKMSVWTRQYWMKHSSHCANIFKTKTTHSTKNLVTRTTTNTHRKNRNSRGPLLKLQPSFDFCHIIPTLVSSKKSASSSSLSLSPLSSLSSSLSLSLPNRLWHCAMVTLVLFLINSIKFTDAITQNNNYSTTSAMMPTATTSSSIANVVELSQSKYSQPLKADDNNDDSFRPIIPKDMNLEAISQNVFTKSGQYRVFEPVDSDLRATLVMNRKTYGAIDIPTQLQPDAEKFNERRNVMQTLHTKHKVQETFSHEMTFKPQQTRTMADNQTKTFSSTDTKAFETNPKPSQLKAQNYDHQQVLDGKIKVKGHYLPSNNQLPPIISGPLISNKTYVEKNTTTMKDELGNEMKELENLLAEYVDSFFDKGQYQPKPELIIALQQNISEMRRVYDEKVEKYLPIEVERNRPVRQVVQRRADGDLDLNIPRALESGRLLFFTGLKKFMWPIYMGLQILKSLMFALLLPTLIGSFGKFLGKGISSGSAPLFIRPMDEPQDLDFKDNFNFDDDGNKFTLIDDANAGGNVKDTNYAYNQAEASQAHNQYAYNTASSNQQTLSSYGMNERQQLMQDTYLSALQSLGAASFKNSVSLSGSSSGSSGGGGGGLAGLVAPTRQKPAAPANMNTFQQFQKVPASSLLLSNYDPFYSPLLSRLDSVFAQLKLNSDDENCREKLICLMYANPAKYAPYSNLVSAQLSRELNELRKPTSDNPDILRFFKYMRAAKDGQDGIDCEESFDKCTEFKDFENPAMVSTYHDINKLVQARKFI